MYLIKKLMANSELMWTVIAQIIQLMSGLLIIKLLTSTLSLNSYGNFSLIMAASSFVLTMPFTAIQQGFYRYWSVYLDRKQLDNFFSSMIYGVSILSFCYCIIVYISFLVSDFSLFWKNNSLLIAFFILSEVYKVYLRAVTNADRERKIYAISIVVEFLIKTCVVLFLYVFPVKSEIEFVLVGYILANSISAVFCFHFYRGFFLFKLKAEYFYIWKSVLKFSSPLLVWAVFGWLRDSSLRWTIDLNLNTELVAVFAALTSLCIVVPVAMQSIISAYVIPILYQKSNSDEKVDIQENFKKLTSFLYVISLILTLIVFTFSESIIFILTDEKYAPFSFYFPWMFFSYFFFSISMLKGSLFLANFKAGKLLFPNVVSGSIVFTGTAYMFVFPSFDVAFYSYCSAFLSYFIAVEIEIFRDSLHKSRVDLNT